MSNMSLLDRVNKPSDLRELSLRELVELSEEIRAFLISNVSRTGGHLGPNLGVVELTVGIHRVFESPRDRIIFDTGHQSYIHKILTGRADGFSSLRQSGGMSGYPSRTESEHDWVENSHASTSLSWAQGMARAMRLKGEPGSVVALIGDGALTGGMAWEALNNIATQPDLPLVIVVNDNGRSYRPTVGGLANHLSGLRTDQRYEKALSVIKNNLQQAPLFGKPVYDLLHGLKVGLKDWLLPQGMFSDLGLKYIGPIDGHDMSAVISSLEQAKGFGSPVIVHFITRKGNGFAAAENNEEDRLHAIGRINEITGEPLAQAGNQAWTDAFGEALCRIGEKRPDVVVLTAAMLHPTGLGKFASAFPERTFDVGIAEQHAMTAAAGLAAGGLHPIFAVYSTFMNRAFDQLLLDVGMHRAGVTVILDRAGITGPDGASHHGIWDVSLAGMVPGLFLGQPRDRARLERLLERATGISDSPSLLRFAKGSVPDPIEAVTTIGDGDEAIDLLRSGTDQQVLIIGYGAMVPTALRVAEILEEAGIGTTVADPFWSLPFGSDLVDLINGFNHVVTIEDNLLRGGLGEGLRNMCSTANQNFHTFGIPSRFVEHGSRQQILTDLGLSAEQIADAVLKGMR